MRKPELLAPAGDFEKLEMAVKYGADAVYVAGTAFGLRAAAGNFDEKGLVEAVRFVRENGKKIYVAVNIYARNADLREIERFLTFLEAIGADAAIVADLGVFAIARRGAPKLPLHISTQANVTNADAARLLRSLGAERVICARELRLGEIKEIAKTVETEMFCHGAMCVAYSGRCLLSAVMTGRSGNCGECAHPCRYSYNIVEEKRSGEFFPVEADKYGTYIMSSFDLRTIEFLPKIVETGVASLKIEGRGKTAFYAASVVKAYREAIDDLFDDKDKYLSKIGYYKALLGLASHRAFSSGFYLGENGKQSVFDGNYIKKYDFVGIVRGFDEKSGKVTVEERNKFVKNDVLKVLSPHGAMFEVDVGELYDEEGNVVEFANRPKQIVNFYTRKVLKPLDILVKETQNV